MKLIIYVTGSYLYYGHQRSEYIWSVKHGVYIYQGKEWDASEFNAIIDRALKHPAFDDMHPSVKIVDITEPAAAPKEITLEEAEEIVNRLAPHRLKKKTGPKSELQSVEV